MECVLEKPVAPLLPSPPPAGQFFYARCRARFWSWRRDSNPRPSDYKSDALPTELRQQLGKGASPRKLIPRIPSRCPGQLYKVPQRQIRVQAIGFPRRSPLPCHPEGRRSRPEGPYARFKHRCGRLERHAASSDKSHSGSDAGVYVSYGSSESYRSPQNDIAGGSFIAQGHHRIHPRRTPRRNRARRQRNAHEGHGHYSKGHWIPYRRPEYQARDCARERESSRPTDA
jgi:hypothetical protein